MAWAPDYCSVEELAAFLRIDDGADDTQLSLAIAAASRAVDRACGRQFGLLAAPEDRYYSARWNEHRQRWVVEIDDLMTLTGLTVSFDTDDDGTYPGVVDNYQLKPVNAAANGRPWTELVVHPTSTVLPTDLIDGVEVQARFGWTAVPGAVTAATLLQASRVAARRDSPFGVAGSPQEGSEVRLLARLDPDVEVALRDYKRRAPRAVFA